MPRGTQATPLAVRFWSRVTKSPGCWKWQGWLDRNGYGQISVSQKDKQRLGAHRVALWLATGKKPPRNSVTRHLCNNPCCVRPSHLRLGTYAENTRQSVREGRNAFGEKSGMSVLTRKAVQIIRKSRGALNRFAEKYGVSISTIWAARVRRTWQSVKGHSQVTGYACGDRNRSSKLTEKNVREIRASPLMGIQLAKKFKVSKSVISVVRSRKSWKHVK